MTPHIYRLFRSVSNFEKRTTSFPASDPRAQVSERDSQPPAATTATTATATPATTATPITATPPADNQVSGRSNSVVRGLLHVGGEMQLLHKAAQHVTGQESKKDKRGGSRDERQAKEKHSHGWGSSQKSEPPKPGSLSIEMESPPLVMYGSTTSSTGALMSGQFQLRVGDESIRLDSLELELIVEQKNKRPVEKQCSECTTHSKALRHWTFTSDPTTFRSGVHSFPFSYLLEGHLPASTDTPLGSIVYVLRGRASQIPRTGSTTSSAGSAGSSRPSTPTNFPDISVSHVLPVLRAIPTPENDRTAIRVFPPTNMQAMCTLPPLIHPITSGFPVLLRLSGVAEYQDPGKTVRTWRLKKLSWRLEEHSVVVSQACDKHAARIGGPGKGIKHENIEVLGGKELREGWKSDYNPPSIEDASKQNSSSGTVEIELICGPKPRRHDDTRPSCDVDTPSGFNVRHKLVIECVVTEELHPVDKPKWVAPTGVARILRMGFEIRVTERQGLGVSWDEEQPPVYQDVPESPPGYNRGQGRRLSSEIEMLEPGARPIPGRATSHDSENSAFDEPPPSYAENRMGIADDEDWDVQRVHLSEGIRPPGVDAAGDARSRSRGLSPVDAAGTSAAAAQQPGPSASTASRPRLNAADFDTEDLSDMMRGRRMIDEQLESDGVGRHDE